VTGVTGNVPEQLGLEASVQDGPPESGPAWDDEQSTM